MILGYFDLFGTPYIEAHISIERLGVNGYVQFLVDTGAYSGALHPADGRMLGCRFELLTEPHQVGGIGGSQEYFEEEAVITFQDQGGNAHSYAVDIDIAGPSPDLEELPSLLGRDFINQVRMTYHRNEDLLQVEGNN